jgi:hypothetical protein
MGFTTPLAAATIRNRQFVTADNIRRDSTV